MYIQYLCKQATNLKDTLDQNCFSDTQLCGSCYNRRTWHTVDLVEAEIAVDVGM